MWGITETCLWRVDQNKCEEFIKINCEELVKNCCEELWEELVKKLERKVQNSLWRSN